LRVKKVNNILMSDIANEGSDTQIFKLPKGLTLKRKQIPIDYEKLEQICQQIDMKKGALFSSNFEFPGRYSRWDIGFINPPIEIRSKSNSFVIEALNKRGIILLNFLKDQLCNKLNIILTETSSHIIEGLINKEESIFMEEERTKQPSIFDLIREIKSLFTNNEDKFLGLYGAFGYDLIFQFENISQKKHRNKDDSDLHLYMPDEIVVIDHKIAKSFLLSYEFEYNNQKTDELQRDGLDFPYNPKNDISIPAYQPGYYADLVRKASISFQKGDLFEVVPTQVIYEKCLSKPSEVFKRLRTNNPSPYGFIINLGKEFLVGCSPEMYVRVVNGVVETCPISGTIKRGNNSIEDAENIKSLINSDKDEAELTMCTDVDRNDKSRICIPGTVEVVGRRQIEKYSHLFHTVDHIKGKLRKEYDALDAFITHMWAVTVTGAPKLEAMRWIEENEEKPRGWYGGAVGWFAFDGSLNTGLTLRTMRIKDGVAEIRVGATLLYDSVPEEEEEETLIKAKALVQSLSNYEYNNENTGYKPRSVGENKNVLIVDHEDSFVHNLANYVKQTGAKVVVYRSEIARQILKDKPNFDLVILSPGPGTPERFNIKETIRLCLENEIPVFGICLGHQGIIEYFGGKLNFLFPPMHGKKSKIYVQDDTITFKGIKSPFLAGRYHSIYASHVSDDLKITALSEDNIVMGVKHKTKPIVGIQFHPESIMTSYDNNGIKIIENIMKYLAKPPTNKSL